MVTTKQRPVTETPPRLIRDPEFAKRLTSACDGHAQVPAMHQGRLTWVVREMERRFNESVTVESVRKWFAGEAKPRPEETKLLAELLQVDVAWLQIGIDPTMGTRERKVRNANADGAVNLVAGLIAMDGGFPAFPQKDEGSIDLHAIIRGAKYDFHVALADDEGAFAVPTKYEDVIVLGLVRDGFNVEVFEITGDQIEDHGHRRGGSIEVTIPRKKLKRIDSFRDRI